MAVKPCANFNVTGCTGLISQRGNILCETCIQVLKTTSKNKRESDIHDLMVRNSELEQEIQKLKNTPPTVVYTQEFPEENHDLCKAREKQLEILLHLEKENNTKHSTDISYHLQLEKENDKLTQLLQKQRSENENLVKERGTYEMTHSQIKLDYEKLLLDNERVKSLLLELTSQNEGFVRENEQLRVVLDEKKTEASKVQPSKVQPSKVEPSKPVQPRPLTNKPKTIIPLKKNTLKTKKP